MVKPVWIAVTLAVGIALGLIIARVGDQTSVAPAAAVQLAPTEVPAPRAATGAAVAVPVPGPAAARRASGSGAAASPAQTSAMSPPPADGAAFTASIENAPAPVYRDSMVEMHEQFEREARDDSWAYLREAEIESALVMETSVGNFRKERIECRATMCELELAARGEVQIAALKKWYEGVSALPPEAQPSSHLRFRMASYSTEGGGAAVKFVYVAPQAVAAPGN